MLNIGNLKIKYPIIQGGMAINVSMAKLAGAVAREGGMGVIAGTALNPKKLIEEIKKAKEIACGNGAIGVNVMFAVSDFFEMVETAIEAKIDFITFGAGFSRDIFEIGKKHNTPIIPIVSSVRLAKISQKLGAAAIVAEGSNAGGHLGTDLTSWEIISEIKESVNIPVFGAGGVVTPEDAKRMLDLGADGIQMGTRFAATEECEVGAEFKEMYIKAKKDDVVEIMSSAGLPANAIRSPFVEKILAGNPDKPTLCTNCLKKCSHDFCVNERLVLGHDGNVEEGIVFAGKDVWKIDEILSVKEVFERFKTVFE